MKSKRIFSILGILALCGPIFVLAQTKAAISINPNIPGLQNVSNTGPCGWVANFYTFALIIGGILAFGAVVFGGVKYATSAGNASAQTEGRAWIWSALTGIFLLAAAYLILYTINPDLTVCSLPQLSTLAITGATNSSKAGSSGGSTSGTSSGSTSTGCASGQCQALPNCTPVPGVTNCGGSQGMVDQLNCIDQSDNNYTVNEGYPPTVTHSDPGHNDGCSIDVHVQSCAAVNQLVAAATACHAAQVLNEYTQCGGKTYGTTTGGNIHIAAQKGDGGC